MPQDDPIERKRLLSILEYLKGVLAALLAQQSPPVTPIGLYPKVARLRDQLIAKMASLGHPIRVTAEYRSIETQNALYAIGRTRPGTIVTNAKGGESFHNHRVAFDVVFVQEGYSGPWNLFGEEVRKAGGEWGGDWISFVDRPHVQLTLGYTIQQFKSGNVDYTKFQ